MEFTEQRFDYSKGRKDAPELTLMVGVSGSGKSVLAKRWVEDNRGNTVRLNRDNLRSMLFCDVVTWSRYNEEITRNYEKAGVKLALSMGRDVIVDDTNCLIRTRHDFEEIARDYQVKFRIVCMTTPLKWCIERDAKRHGKERVGEGVIMKQHKDLNAIQVSPRAYDLTPMNRAESDRKALRFGEFSRRLPNAKFILVDIDGTVADHAGKRGPFEENKVLLDQPYPVVVAWVQALYPHYNIIVVSGRHSSCAEDTVAWLEGHHVPFDLLVMRPAGNNEHDYIVKKALLDDILTTIRKDEVFFALDDRPQVIEKCWKVNGIKVFPVRGTTDHAAGCEPKFDSTRRCVNCGALENF